MMEVVSPGLLTSVQDLGRYGHQHEGVSPGGAMDAFALRAANLLTGNDENAAALEVTMQGPTLRFVRDTAFALGGADLSATVEGTPVPPWRTVLARAGSRLAFGAGTGCRTYVAVAGGVDVPSVLGSRSTCLRAGFGGHEGRALRKGDRLRIGAAPPLAGRIIAALAAGGTRRTAAACVIAPWGISSSLRPRYSAAPVVRLIEGAHVSLLTADARQRLVRNDLRVGAQSDRMGYRLEGPTLETTGGRDLLSEGVAFGTVQLPPGGVPIVLMADRQTTGGYPRIGEVASVDLPLLAQLRPGDRLRFRTVTVGEAQAAEAQREAELAQARLAIRLRHP